MGGRIPQPVRLEVIRMWCEDTQETKLPSIPGLARVPVSGIIQQCRQDDADFDLLRGVALELRDRGMRVKDYAPLL